MKLNISYPTNGTQKLVTIDDEHKLRAFYDKRISQLVKGDFLGDEWKGYIFKITGGNDKEGFPMLQGIMTTGRVRLLLRDGSKCFRAQRDGERVRKSVHGCIVDSSLSVLALVIVKKGDKDIPGLTDIHVPRQYGPKRAGKIRKLFNLTKEDDVRDYVIRRPLTYKNPDKVAKKPKTVAPKIQRLITPVVLQRRRRLVAIKAEKRLKSVKAAAEYQQLMKSLNKKCYMNPSMADKIRRYEETQPSNNKNIKTSVKGANKQVLTKQAVQVSKKPVQKSTQKNTQTMPSSNTVKPKIDVKNQQKKAAPVSKPNNSAKPVKINNKK